MKNQFKTNLNFLKSLMLLCCALSFTNCQKDDTSLSSKTSETASQFQFVRSEVTKSFIENNREVSMAVNFFKEKTIQRNLQGKVVTDSITGLEIDDSYASYLETPNGVYHSFTFNVINTPKNGGLENVFFSLQPDGTYKKFLAHYDVTNDELELMKSGVFIDLEQKLRITPLPDNTFTNGKLVYDSDAGCLYDIQNYEATTCDGLLNGQPVNHTYEQVGVCGAATQPKPAGTTTTILYCTPDLEDPIMNQGNSGSTNTNQPNYNPGGGFSNSTSTAFPKPEPWEEVKDCLNQISATSATNLTREMVAFLRNNPLVSLKLNQYLKLNNCNVQIQAFGIEAILALMNGGEVDYDDRIIKDSSFVDTKADCVYKLLKSTNNNLFKNVLETFTEGKAKYKLMFKIGAVTSGNEAETSGPENGIITITISPSASSKSSLEIASTIIHESIHAELKRIYLNGNTGPNPFTTVRYNHLLDLYQFYETHGADITVASNASHMFMVQLYLDPLAVAIQALDDSFYSSLDYYKKYAWEGLEAVALATNPPLITQSQLDIYEQLNVITENDSKTQECD